MPRVVFVDHSFHRVTRSSDFFTAILRESAEVVVLESNSWRQGRNVPAARVDDEGADVAVFWQTLPDPTDLLKLSTPAVWVPMYDSAVHSPRLFWDVLSATGVDIISFCRALSAIARSHGIRVSDYVYYPDPSRLPHKKYGGLGARVFFWDRGYLQFDLLRACLDPRQVRETVVRRAPNPDLVPSRITDRDRRDFKVRVVDDIPGRRAYLDLLATCNVFFAPRRYEGIGMTFLEAMAMGLAVVAVDSPTMNEYIRDRDNGFLVDADHPRHIDLSTCGAVGERALASVRRGHADWVVSTRTIAADVLSARPGTGPSSRRLEALAALLTAAERAKSLVPPTYRARITEALRRRTTGG